MTKARGLLRQTGNIPGRSQEAFVLPMRQIRWVGYFLDPVRCPA
jgi:hypothetical protein